MLTILGHPQGQALLQTTVLTSVPAEPVYFAIPVFLAQVVVGVGLTSSEEALRVKVNRR